MARRNRLLLGVTLEGAGWHPAAWRFVGAEPAGLFGLRWVATQAQRAEHAGLDFVAVDDAFGVQAVGPGGLRGRLDALLVLAAIAPLTRAIGLVAVTDTTHTEPFHLAKNVATLDHVSYGRAGWWPKVSTSGVTAALFGRKPAAPLGELWAEAGDVIEVVRRLCDSWEDDAIIRDVATGRYIDRDKLHYVDFEGPFFSVRGPSITPRSPQGQPLVVVEASCPEALAVAARHADVVVVAGCDGATLATTRRAVRSAASASGREPDELTVLARIDVVLGASADGARDALSELDAALAEGTVSQPHFAGDAEELARLLAALHADGAIDGALLRPAVLDRDLAQIASVVVPRLEALGLHTRDADGTHLRARFGLERPPNCYATAR